MSNYSDNSDDEPDLATEPSSDDEFDLATEPSSAEWRDSDERKRMVRNLTITWIVTFLIVIVAAAIFAKNYLHLRNGRIVFTNNTAYQTYLVAEGIALLGWFFLMIIISARSSDVYKGQFADGQLLKRKKDELSQAEDAAIVNGSIDFTKLWQVTQKRISLYHTIATEQSKRSFIYGQWAASAGFLIIVISGVIALFARSAAAAVASAITGVAGGGLGAYIGATFMRSQDVASAQLRDYFRQPLELSRYLMSEHLLSSLSDSDRAAAVQKLIEAIAASGKSTE